MLESVLSESLLPIPLSIHWIVDWYVVREYLVISIESSSVVNGTLLDSVEDFCCVWSQLSRLTVHYHAITQKLHLKSPSIPF